MLLESILFLSPIHCLPPFLFLVLSLSLSSFLFCSPQFSYPSLFFFLTVQLDYRSSTLFSFICDLFILTVLHF
ncbi:hypothetical protein EDB82DRAFT_490364 [Fusarium venenatum]|uniref:uncharacterized protein n=1 Tax=Fusarium venenatum TaxID=56646 RepID=UPI001DE59BC4|nr:hypothetical protein EDB82DRAFT_490364 [Fusarium venenatum]